MTAAVAIDLPEALADQASTELFELGALGVEVRDREVLPMPGTPPLRAGRSVLVAYFEDSMPALEAATALTDALGTDEHISFTLLDVPPTDWDKAWREHFKPVKIGARLWIRPSWEASQGEPEVVLDPGTAFGTGAHATTAMCLLELERELAPGAEVLDVGCGSGILAIGALKLGAGRAVAVDNDPEAVRVTRENALRNGVTVEAGTELPGGRFPLVVANILAETLIELAEPIAARVAPGGVLLLSGILGEQADRVAAAYLERGLSREPGRGEGEWVLVKLRRAR